MSVLTQSETGRRNCATTRGDLRLEILDLRLGITELSVNGWGNGRADGNGWPLIRCIRSSMERPLTVIRSVRQRLGKRTSRVQQARPIRGIRSSVEYPLTVIRSIHQRPGKRMCGWERLVTHPLHPPTDMYIQRVMEIRGESPFQATYCDLAGQTNDVFRRDPFWTSLLPIGQLRIIIAAILA